MASIYNRLCAKNQSYRLLATLRIPKPAAASGTFGFPPSLGMTMKDAERLLCLSDFFEVGFEESRLRETLQFQFLGRNPDKSRLGSEADQFRLRNFDAALPRQFPDAAKNRRNGRFAAVGKIHRYLDNPSAPQGQSKSADGWESPGGFADLPGDMTGDVQIMRREVDVEGNKREARADDHGAQTRVENVRPRVGFPGGLAEALGKLFVTDTPDVRQRYPPGIVGRLAVKIDRDPEALGGFSTEALRRRHGIRHHRTVKRNEGHNVRRPDSGMSPFVFAQIDPRKGCFARSERRTNNIIRLPQKGEDAPVVVGVLVHVREADVSRFFDRPRDGTNRLGVSPFTEIGNTFQDLHGFHTW